MEKNRQYLIAKEGWGIMGFVLIIAVGTWWAFEWWVILPLFFLVFTAYFFRNPERSIPSGEGLFVSPADGLVMNVETVQEGRYVNGTSVKVTIFLNLFNVHINRSPISGVVEYVERLSGLYVPASRRDAGDINARNYMGMQTAWGRILVVQITGLIARRIVCRAKVGDNLDCGERFGLIRFGSCTEVYLPSNIVIGVAKGDKVKGGETILGRMPE